MAQDSKLYTVLLVLALLMGGYFLLRSLQQTSSAVDAVSQGSSESVALIALKEVFSRQQRKIDSLDALARKTNQWYNDSISKLLDSLAHQEAIETVRIDTLLIHGDTAGALKLCQSVLLSCQERASLARNAADSLSLRVSELLKRPKRRCGVFTGFGLATSINKNDLRGFVGLGCLVL